MVTFSIPGDDVVETTNGTPRPRSQLPFAKRASAAASPIHPSSSRRIGTPYASSSRKLLTTRDGLPPSSLNPSSTGGTARNIFRASAITNSSPSTSTFSPSIPSSTMKKVFAPGAATPEPSRVYRESIAHATPRGMAAKTGSKELFTMRIASPPPELTGELLTQKVPKEWNAKGSIYADQFLAHLCPPDLDEEQRRQFFCILDLRRLKYAANEIFNNKDWKLNVINFAKEFEKSRSIILLRYGLYEFQNVKPSKDVLKRWRREHGLPEPEDEEADESTPSRPSTSKKRKATDGDMVAPSSTPGKRRALDQTTNHTEAACSSNNSTPMGKNKRKASMSEEQPAKMQKSTPTSTPTPSSAKSLFEKIANKSATATATGSPAPRSASLTKASSFNANKPATSSNLARSVFTATKPLGTVNTPATAGSGGSNIFGYLSDASSAKNSGLDADAESESDSERSNSQEVGHSDEPSSTSASGAGDAGSRIGSSLFGRKPELSADGSGASTGLSSAPGTRDNTPGRSLFDRVTKGDDGQPVRVEEAAKETEVQVNADGDGDADEEEEVEVEAEAETKAVSESQFGLQPKSVQERPAVVNQTWNPTTTPIKFAPSTATAPTASLFGSSGTNSSGSIFAAKTTAPSNLFGAAKQGSSSIRDGSTGVSVDQAEKDGGESDKENESQPTKKALFESKTSAGQSAFGSNPSTAQSANSDARKPVANFFGASATAPGSKVETKTSEASTAPSLFVQQSMKPAETAAPSFLFGAKPVETKATTTTTTAPASLFGAGATSKIAPEPNNATNNNLFGAKPPSTAGSLFSSSAFAPAQPSLFGGTSSATSTDSAAAKTDAPKLTFGFGNTTTSSTTAPSSTASKSLFGGPKSPTDAATTGAAAATTTTTTTTGNDLFGSPMKQDDNPSPAKKMFNSNNIDNGLDGNSSISNGDSAPTFKFGAVSSQPAATTTKIFGAPTTLSQPTSGLSKTAPGTISFGAGAPASSSSSSSSNTGFNFSFGGVGTTAATPATGFQNPFTSGNGGSNAAAPATTPSSGGTFAFGAGSSAAPGGTSSSFQFGGTSSSSSAPVFGRASGPGAAPSFNFTAGGAAPQGTGSVFGSNQAAPVFNLQPPAGGSTTTGTNSPLNFGGGSSLATTPAAGTPEPATQADAAKDGEATNDEDGEKHEQVNLVDAVDEDEEVLHEVRAKVLKFVPASEKSEDGGDDKAKSKSPWSTQGVGQLRLLQHKSTKLVRLLLRAEPRGHVALNRAVLPTMSYKADEKYVKLTTSNEKGNGLETWMIQVKTKALASDLASAMEENKESNKT
ncbi:hypothetical protein E4U43_004064 [Claviceps pusilla]|uniref:RanBD1 domain-containing protein n=1 Tax=Claviceps pusilla TaxID=123648 RepID=A0A9P7T1Y3_9HYPO|nr:hypothetical protein E4U43_004064 [Claviceps pusilla]